MKAGRIHYFGPPNAIVIDEIPCPRPEKGELVVRVAAAGVGPWDALLREGKSIVQPPLPIILGSDLAGIVDCLGTGVIQFKPGEEVFGGSSGASEAHDSIGIGLVNEQRTNRAQEL